MPTSHRRHSVQSSASLWQGRHGHHNLAQYTQSPLAGEWDLPPSQPDTSAFQTHHSDVDNRAPRTCRSCGKTFAYSQNMLRHRRKCEGTFHLSCIVCGQLFSRSDYYNAHMRSKHAGVETSCGSDLSIQAFGEAGHELTFSGSSEVGAGDEHSLETVRGVSGGCVDPRGACSDRDGGIMNVEDSGTTGAVGGRTGVDAGTAEERSDFA